MENSFAPTIERFTGFGAQYDEARPAPPRALAGLLAGFARCERPAVVDLGCGTGLSTRYWSGYARSVTGVEPTDSMREQAESRSGDNIVYRRGFSHETGLPEACADIVTCAQSLHWMEPAWTFRESVRILREGGVFAACDYDWPPCTSFWEVDQAYMECVSHAHRLERDHHLSDDVPRWDKATHLARMQESGVFRYTRECLLHHEDEGGVARLIGLLLSQGHLQTLLKNGFTEADLHIDRLRETAIRYMGEGTTRWVWGSRVRLGIK